MYMYCAIESVKSITRVVSFLVLKVCPPFPHHTEKIPKAHLSIYKNPEFRDFGCVVNNYLYQYQVSVISRY